MGADELSAALWRERRHLELLLFRLETQLLHVRAGSWHWLKFTASELESVLENLRFETLARNIEAAAVATEWLAPANATLPTLASAAPPGIWPELLQEHHRSMALLLRQINAAVAANVDALEKGPDATAELPGPGTPLSAELVSAEPLEPADDLMLLAQNANQERALAVTKDCSLPLLEEFLGLA